MSEELKELKSREQLLINDNNELETENIMLQKQLSDLKSANPDIAALRLKVGRLMGEVLHLEAAVDEANRSRVLAEKQKQEAIASAQKEHEHRTAIEKQYERMKNDEHLSQLNNVNTRIDDVAKMMGELLKQVFFWQQLSYLR